jgi:glycine oxidase
VSAAPYVVVAGAGVFGLASALALVEAGARVLLVAPQPEASSASSVAAGLLAPVGEAVFDPTAATHYPSMRAALDLWPAFASRSGLDLESNGAVIPVDQGPALSALGYVGEAHPKGWLVDDARVADPVLALVSLRTRLIKLGGQLEARAIAKDDWQADSVVLATGSGSMALISHAPEFDHLSPVKGQIAVLPHGPRAGPTLRWAGGYLAPQKSGARAGATMEVGRADLIVEPAAIARLLAAAQAHAPELDTRGAYGEAGVRMQTPDGLPLVGPSRSPKTLLAAGARRNGWLYAPLVGQMVAAYVMGQDPGPWAALLHPGRFERK